MDWPSWYLSQLDIWDVTAVVQIVCRSIGLKLSLNNISKSHVSTIGKAMYDSTAWFFYSGWSNDFYSEVNGCLTLWHLGSDIQWVECSLLVDLCSDWSAQWGECILLLNFWSDGFPQWVGCIWLVHFWFNWSAGHWRVEESFVTCRSRFLVLVPSLYFLSLPCIVLPLAR